MWNNNYAGYPSGNGYSNPQQYGQIQMGGYTGQPAQPVQQPPTVQQMPMRDDRIWTEGVEAARSYLVAAGCSVVLWDINRDTIYFKQTDHSGRPYPMMILDYTVRDQNQKPDYITRTEFQQFVNSLMAHPAQPAAQAPALSAQQETEVNNG